MPHYRLVASGRPDVHADEIILSRDEESGEVEHALSTHEARQIPDEHLSKAKNLAERLGFKVVEVEAPEGEELKSSDDPQDEVSVDTVAEHPPVADVDQESPSAPQQGQAEAGTTTADSGSAFSNTTTVNPNPTTNP